MRVKLYTAPGMPEAMAMIRTELGADAVILNSRRINGGVEVTAGRDEPAAAPTRAPSSVGAARPDSCPLLAHGTPEPLAAKLRAGPLPFALSVAFRFQPIDPGTLRNPLLFIGPPGAGKTLTVARLATRLVIANTPPPSSPPTPVGPALSNNSRPTPIFSACACTISARPSLPAPP